MKLEWHYFGDTVSLAYPSLNLAPTESEQLYSILRDPGQTDDASVRSLFILNVQVNGEHPFFQAVRRVVTNTRRTKFPWKTGALDKLECKIVKMPDSQGRSREDEMLLTPDTLYLSWDQISRDNLFEKRVSDLGISPPNLPESALKISHMWMMSSMSSGDILATCRSSLLSNDSGINKAALRVAATLKRKNVDVLKQPITSKSEWITRLAGHISSSDDTDIGSFTALPISSVLRRDASYLTAAKFGEQTILAFQIGTGSNNGALTDSKSEAINTMKESASPIVVPLYCPWPEGALTGCRPRSCSTS
ncbi:MAG: hypothetical protein AAGI52_07460 [Bacteroidota bacterium]